MNNTNSLLATRYKDAIWMKGDCYNITIIGAGGIGRGLTELISLLGHKITVIDDDIVELHNSAAQGYSIADIGRPKTTVLSDHIVEKYGLENINAYSYRLSKDNIGDILYGCDIIISCVDNMETRKLISDNVDLYNQLFIDARLTIDTYQIFFIQNNNQLELYKNDYLFHDDEVDEGACTIRQTQFMAAMLQGNLISILTNYFSNKIIGKDIYPVDFFTSYNNMNRYAFNRNKLSGNSKESE